MPTHFPIGVCSWSLDVPCQPAALTRECQELGIETLHLGLNALVEMPGTERTAALREFKQMPIPVSAGMIAFPHEDYGNLAKIRATGGLVPDHFYTERLDRVLHAAQICHDLGLKLLSTHAGFIPENHDPSFPKFKDRIEHLLSILAPLGVTLLFETGQETAATLSGFLIQLDPQQVGINFDPANMLLYGKGNPLEAIVTLRPWVRHVHIKDALCTRPAPTDPDAWRGHEVRAGTGDAHLPQLLPLLAQLGYTGPLAIEREFGDHRRHDIEQTLTLLREWMK